MTDEPREDLQPEKDEDVEGHAPPVPGPVGEKLANDDDDDVEAHAPPTPAPPVL